MIFVNSYISYFLICRERVILWPWSFHYCLLQYITKHNYPMYISWMCVCYRDLIQIKRPNQESILPQQATNQVLVSGYDITSSTMMTILASTNITVPLGFTMSYLDHLQCSIYPQSSNSLKGIDVALGTMDTDYRGEDKVIIAKNTSSDHFNTSVNSFFHQSSILHSKT